MTKPKPHGDTTTGTTGAGPESATATPAGPRGRRASDDALLARMSGLGATTTPATTPATAKPRARRATTAAASPETTTSTPTTPTRRPTARTTATKPAAATTTRGRSGRGGRGPMPGEQPTPLAYPVRVSLTTTVEQNRALNQARVEDGIDKTARIRTLLHLWQTDEKLRRRVEKNAGIWR